MKTQYNKAISIIYSVMLCFNGREFSFLILLLFHSSVTYYYYNIIIIVTIRSQMLRILKYD
ncbi:hypothetical protein T4D_5684 [Trichinella pseudospiralis]|uniref:Uncharacterized protein n=1 Tax=Trichinella pseudospiralis TaxID=6337 RepID=A0A0V1FZQ2_TRIPS|nr:hypothetical protein T4D_5684 [Trichinella pseudospiralis]